MLFQKAEKTLKAHRKDLNKFGVNGLAIFGSFVQNKQKQGSDIDILVDFDSKKGLFVFLDLKDYLEEILDCDVDLVTKKALHPALKKRILSEAKQIF